MEKVKAYFDGSCKGNIASWGYHIEDPYYIENCGVLSGGVTSNVAEYTGLLKLLQELDELAIDNAMIHGDNEMVVKIVTKKYGMKGGKWNPHKKYPDLKDLAIQCEKLLTKGNHTIRHISRDRNVTADALAESAYKKSDAEFKSIPFRVDPVIEEQNKQHDRQVETFKGFMFKEHGIDLTDYDVMMIKRHLKN